MSKLLDSVRTRLFGQPVIQQTDVTDELRGAGMAFANLIEKVATAVAEAQGKFDKTASDIVSALAKTEVDTVQAVVSNYDDSGNLTGVEVIAGKTSALVAIGRPSALQFDGVHAEGCFRATEIATTSTSNVNVNLAGVSVGSRGFGLRGPSIGASMTNVNTNLQSETTQDLSVGIMSMTAKVGQKEAAPLPKPPLVLRGPSLTLSVFGSLPVEIIQPAPVQATDPPYLEKRLAVIRFELKNAAGAVITTGKTIAVDGGGLDWGVTDSAGTDVTTGPKTDAQGIFYIKVSRAATSNGEPKKDFLIRGSLNLVNGTLSVSL
jgi:hypothetical protein